MQATATPYIETDDRPKAPHHAEREVTLPPMPSVPPDLFRRIQAYKYLEDAVESLNRVERALLGDFAVTAKAGKYHLASIVAQMIDRPDLQDEFDRVRDEAVMRARQELSMRRPAGSRKPRPKPLPQPDESIRTRKPVDQPYRDKGRDTD